MIEFYGRLSEKCLNQFSKKQNLRNSLFFMIFTFATIILTVVLLLLKIEGWLHFCTLSIIMIIVNILLFIVPMRSIVFRFPTKITITNDLITYSIDYFSKQNKPKIRKLKNIKKIIEYEEWYLIIFKRDITDLIICQKNLITKGSLDTFETLFKNKIIKK